MIESFLILIRIKALNVNTNVKMDMDFIECLQRLEHVFVLSGDVFG